MRFQDLARRYRLASPRAQAATTGGLTGLISGAIIYVLSRLLGIELSPEEAGTIIAFVALVASLVNRLHIKALLPIVLMLLLPSVAHAQEAIPSKLLELETIQPPTLPESGSWAVAQGKTTLYVSGSDSARVYFTGHAESRVIIAKVAGASWVRAGMFGWFPVTSVLLASYNAIEDAHPGDWNYTNFNPLWLANTYAVILDGPDAMVPGSVVPRGQRARVRGSR